LSPDSSASFIFNSSELDPLGNGERVIHFDPEVSNCAFQFGMPEQKLARTQVAGLFIDQRNLGAAEAVGAV
jgi:hypothetical protein